MTYRGKVKDGVVVLEPGTLLEEGAEVLVAPVDAAPARSLADRLRPVIGKAKGLGADAASNIDRDLYGQTSS